MKRAMVVGSAGQDGRILMQRLGREGHFALGIDVQGVQSTAPVDLPAIDILQAASVQRAVELIRPDEVYYLAAFHHSAQDRPDNDAALFEKGFAIHVVGLLNFLEAIRLASRQTRLFYAASSRVFGPPATPLQDESTPLNPDCAYGISKAAGMRCVRFYRQVHTLFAASGILYNHESALRPPQFVTQKIIRGALAIQSGKQAKLVLGDLDATVDWGYAPDYVDAMIRILDQPQAEDFIIATGEAHTVREFVEIVFGLLGLDWKQYVAQAPGLVASQGRSLIGNAGRLRTATGWRPSVSFAEMVGLLLSGTATSTA